MSALTLDTPVSLFEPAPPRRLRWPAAAAPRRVRAERPVGRTARAPHGRSPRPSRRRALGRLDLLPSGTHGGRPPGRRARPRHRRWPPPRSRSPLASKGSDAGTVASLSIRGLAAAAIICAAWGFQDRPRLGTLQTRACLVRDGVSARRRACAVDRGQDAWRSRGPTSRRRRARSRWTSSSSPPPPCWGRGPAGRTWRRPPEHRPAGGDRRRPRPRQ